MANFERIRDLRDYLVRLSTTRRPQAGFSMANWFSNECESAHGLHEGFCGTTACLAGHTWLMEGKQVMTATEYWNSDLDVYEEAKKILGLDAREATHMFYGHWGASSSSKTPRSLDGLSLTAAIRYLDLVLDEEDVCVFVGLP